MKKASNLLSKIVYSLFLVVFTIITFYCVRYSVFLRDFEFESHLVRGKDNIAVHVLVICAVLLLSCSISIALDRIKDERKRMRASICANVLVSFVTFSFCIIWLFGGNFYPINDCNTVLQCVERIRQGNYIDFLPQGYLGIYKHQLGLITIIRFLYMFAGTEKELIYGISTDYKVFQIVNCLCVPIIVFFGNKIATELYDNDDKTRANVGIVHSIFMLFALPIFFYTPYVYGEVISATMEILFIWAGICSLKYEQKRIIYFAVMVLSGVIGYFARANFIIVPIAYLCVSLVSAVYRKKIRQLLAPIIILALLVISSRINILYYERISGIRFDQGVPIQCYIAMGLDEYSPVAPGWYNGRNVETYVNANYDKEAAKEAAGNYIHDRLVMFKNGAGISPLVFYKEKMFSQWADATMNCFIETKVHIPEARTWIMDISDPDGKYAAPIMRIMDECQLCMMIGCLLFAVFQLFSKDCKPYKLFIVTILFGGFVFSMIWEAMGRYIFPYYICMLSLAPSGVAMLCNRVISLFCKNRSER